MKFLNCQKASEHKTDVGRAWDWANFRESHEKFVMFGNSAQ